MFKKCSVCSDPILKHSTNTKQRFLSQILKKKKSLVLQTSQNTTIVVISSYAWNCIFIDASFSKTTSILLHFKT